MAGSASDYGSGMTESTTTADGQAQHDDAWLRALASHQAALLDAVRGAPDARAGIAGGVAAYLVWHEQHREAALVLRQPGPTRDRPDGWRQRRDLNRPFFAELARWWAGHAEAGTLRALPPVLVHALWLGPARDVCDLWIQGPSDQSGPGEHAELLADAAWRTVAA